MLLSYLLSQLRTVCIFYLIEQIILTIKTGINGWVISIDTELKLMTAGRTLTKTENNFGPKTEVWGNPPSMQK